jgi:DNA-binding PadR family transcriptional regulator
MSHDLPSDVEQQILLVVWRLGDDAYGVPIRDELEHLTGRSVSAGAIYTTLVRLERKGWLQSSMGAPSPERGGKAKRFFTVTADGAWALQESREVMARLWDGIEAAAAPKGA